ncbi:MAG: SCO family protein [Spirochaetia bacterium]|nr:SCO family protein [Spirochaetia bacterium]
MKTASKAALIVFYAALIFSASAYCRKNSKLPFFDIGGDFHLIDTDGSRFSLTDLRGRPALLFFGYTNCPDACPTILSRLKKIMPSLGSDGSKVEILFVSVDPERDSPAILKKYLEYFKLDVRGLYGNKKEISKVAESFGVFYNKRNIGSRSGYTVDHTTTLFVLDKNGKVRYLFRYADDERTLIPVLKLLLDDPYPAEDKSR